MKRILPQAIKEWHEFRRDRLSLALAFLLPAATLLLFGFGVRLQACNIPLIINDMDGSADSRYFADLIFATNVFVRGSRAGKKAPEEAIKCSQTRGAIVIPHGFGRNLDLAKESELLVYVDGSDISTAQVVDSVVSATCAYFSHSKSTPDFRSYFVIPQIKIWFNPGLKESLFIAPGVFGIVLWMYPALLSAVAVSRELEQGTIVQAYTSNLTALTLLIGKGLTYFCIGLAQAAVTMIIAYVLFGLELKTDPSLLIIATAIYIIGAVSFGLLAGIATKHPTVAVQATATGGFFPSLLLSGFVYPIANIPMPLSLVCLLVPARYYMEVCRDAFERGVGWRELWYEPLALSGFAVLLFAGCWFGMRRMQVDEK